MAFPALFIGVPSGKYPTSFTNKARGKGEPGEESPRISLNLGDLFS